MKRLTSGKLNTLIAIILVIMMVLGMSLSAYAETADSQDSSNAAETEMTTDNNYADAGDAAADTAAGSEENTADAEDSEAVTEEESSEPEEADQLTQEDGELTEDEELAEEEEEPAEEIDGCDFAVAGEEGSYSFDEETGVLTITGNVTVKMKDGVSSTSQRIVVADNATVKIEGLNISAAGGPAIKVNAGVKATLKLAGENTVTGANNYAGVEAGYSWDGNGEPTLSDLVISGSGKLNAKGGANSAGIGGSYQENSKDSTRTSVYYGNIIINSDAEIVATGSGRSAGIGSSGNNGTTSQISASFKVNNDGWGKIEINGGSVTANGVNGGAGIGGGNHVDSGKIIINGGNIVANGNSAGIGAGLGSSNFGGDADKGHGYYYADITINGGTIKAYGGWLSAGIGGGYECDAIITITGGTIVEAIGGNGNNGSYYQGAPGIGAGYQGNVQFTMTGGTIEYAKGGWSAPGIGYGAGIQNYGSKRKEGFETVSSEDSLIKITGGTIELAEGGMYAAGIGGGNGCPVCNIEITGGNITAEGYSDPDNLKAGGAGIGSGVGTGSGLKYGADTKETISITGGSVVAIGGWGASGIGSGACNPYADQITIDAENANIEAYADGTKFAIDTRQLNEDGTTESRTEGRTIIDGYILQGTFVHNYEGEGDNPDQSPEGLDSIILTSDDSGVSKELTRMPEGYRSYATDVASAGTYTVYTDSESIGKGEGRYFSSLSTDTYDAEEAAGRDKTVEYTVSADVISDNFYLYPVKCIVVEKTVEAETGVDLSGLDMTAYFAVFDKEANKYLVNGKDESGSDLVWIKSIGISGGKAQNKAYFINVDDRTYDVKEIDQASYTVDEINAKEHIGQDDYNKWATSPQGNKFGDYTLKRITTKHGGSSDNNATISKDQWTDTIEVINTFSLGSIEVKLTKHIDTYADASGDQSGNLSFVFKVEGMDAEGNTLYEGYVTTVYNKETGDKSEVISLGDVSDIAKIVVTEIYTAGYKADEDSQTIDIAGGTAKKNADGQYEVKFNNRFDGKFVQGSGVLNTYKDKKYVVSGGNAEDDAE